MNYNYYNEKEACKLTKLSKLMLRKNVNENDIFIVSRRHYYKKEIIRLMVKAIHGECELKACKEIENKFSFADVDFSMYVPLSVALKETGLSRQRIFQLRNKNKIEAVKLDGFYFFRKADLRKKIYQVKNATNET